ncbi:hypothetical protein D9M70_595100 [compost metagenome]
MVAPRMLATPRTTGCALGSRVNAGHCSTSLTLNTLMPYSCSPLRRNSSNSRRFCPTSCVRWLTESITPAMPDSFIFQPFVATQVESRHGLCFFERHVHENDIFPTIDAPADWLAGHAVPAGARRTHASGRVYLA